MKLTQTQANVLRIFKQSLDRAFARHYGIMRKRALHPSDCPAVYGKTLDTLFAYIGAMQKKPKSFASLNQEACDVLYRLMQQAYTSAQHREDIEREVLSDLYERAAEYELLAQMPPPKRAREQRIPQTLVERRAAHVDEKVLEWERKLKTAKTKLKVYRRKQKYYLAKKGAAV